MKALLILAMAAATLTAQTTQTKPPTTPAKKPPAAPADAGGAVDSLTNSLQDLNAIRDANLTRVQNEGCPPETAVRLADLRARLRLSESGQALSNEAGVPADAPSIAANWFKRPPLDRPEDASARENRLLTEVLPGATAAAAKSQPVAPQKASEDEIARLKAEIARLSGTCVAARK
jgi:hypothetical protein